MAGAMRAYTEEARAIATEKIYDICAGVEKVSGCAIDAEVIKGYDACINDDKIVDALASAFEGTLGPESYYFMKEPLGFSEDYSFFRNDDGKAVCTHVSQCRSCLGSGGFHITQSLTAPLMKPQCSTAWPR